MHQQMKQTLPRSSERAESYNGVRKSLAIMRGTFILGATQKYPTKMYPT